jgi:hypothetical protein
MFRNFGLILGAGRDIFPGQSIQKPFQFLFTRQMSSELFEVVAKSPGPGAVTPLRGEAGCFRRITSEIRATAFSVFIPPFQYTNRLL